MREARSYCRICSGNCGVQLTIDDDDRIVSIRVREVMNTCYRDLPAIRHRMPWNPLQLHPDDVEALGLEEGALVKLASGHGQVAARIESDDTLRRAAGRYARLSGCGIVDQPADQCRQAISRRSIRWRG